MVVRQVQRQSRLSLSRNKCPAFSFAASDFPSSSTSFHDFFADFYDDAGRQQTRQHVTAHS